MISLIVCSTRQNISDKLEENIRATIGAPYELIVIDNSKNEYSIFSAYNQGAKQSRYDLLCFMHEDIHFHSQEWGVIVASLLNNEQIGVVGVAGSTFKSEVPSPWWISNYHQFPGFLKYHLIQHSSKGVTKNSTHYANRQRDWEEVAVLDGVWLCCRKAVWQKQPFDEKHYAGFHFYDLDFSMAVRAQGLKNIVTYQVLLEHYSAGSMNKQWFAAASSFHRKWKAQLPACTFDLSKEQVDFFTQAALRNHLLNTVSIGSCFTIDWWKYWWSYFMVAPARKENYILLVRYFKSLIRTWIKKS